MELNQAQRIVIFGGTFDPPHHAHIVLPEQVRRAINADLVAYVPAGRSPHKLGRAQTPAAHRLRMLELALADVPHATIVRDEIERGEVQPSYTVHTLEVLRQRLGPAVQMRLLIGADQAAAFKEWREPERIIELAEPVVILRAPQTRDRFLQQLDAADRDAWSSRVVEVDAIPVSASQVRQRMAAGESIDALVPASVARYIAEHGLYADEAGAAGR